MSSSLNHLINVFDSIKDNVPALIALIAMASLLVVGLALVVVLSAIKKTNQ